MITNWNHYFQNKVKQSKSTADPELIAWLLLLRDRRWSRRQKHRLLTVKGSALNIYQSATQDLKAIPLGRWQQRPNDNPDKCLAADLNWLADANHRLLVNPKFLSKDCPTTNLQMKGNSFPTALSEIDDAPIALFSKGKNQFLDNPSIAIVGSRRPTPAGQKIAEALAAELSNLGILIISGMALGIDAAAHQGALDQGEPTVAVMGCGLDTVYPTRHKRLFSEISNNGCLLTEYPHGTPVSRFTFPQRNRIISGLSLGVIIIEAAQRSGTLITARLACEQNRSVMVVPGSTLSRQYKGSHALLQQGASLVTCGEDVLHELQIPLQTKLDTDTSTPTPEEHYQLLEYIYHEPTDTDSIIKASGLSTSEVSSMLILLEMENAISKGDDGAYVKLVD